MGVLISAKQWHDIKDKFPNNVANMPAIIVPAEVWKLKSFWKNKKSNKITQALNDHSDPVGSMIAWCEEMLSNNFYAETYRNEQCSYYIAGVKFYFFDEDDAVMFKLTWWAND